MDWVVIGLIANLLVSISGVLLFAKNLGRYQERVDQHERRLNAHGEHLSKHDDDIRQLRGHVA